MTDDGLSDLVRSGRYRAALAWLLADRDSTLADGAWFAQRRLERRLLLRVGDADGAGALVRETARRAEAAGPAALAGALIDVACHEDAGPALATLARALALAESARDGDLVFDVHMAGLMIALERGDPIGQREWLARAREAVPDADVRTDYCLGEAYAAQHVDPPGALRWAERAIAHARDPFPEAQALAFAVVVGLESGRIDDATVFADRAADAAARIDLPVDVQGYVGMLKAVVRLTAGDASGAATLLDDALGAFPRGSRRTYAARALRAALRALDGDPDAAEAELALLPPTESVAGHAPVAAAELLVAVDRGDPSRFDDAAARVIVDGRLRVRSPPMPLLLEHAAMRAERLRGTAWRDRATRTRAALLRSAPERGERHARALRRLVDGGAPVRVGPLRIVRLLAQGGFGDVYEAVTESGSPVALKTIRAHRLAAGMLANELRAVALLDHPNIVRLLDHGVVDAAAHAMDPRLRPGTPWVATALVAGGALSDRAGSLRWDDVRATLLVVLDALAHAHARGILHLDIKPQNVVGERDGAQLVDFGLAAAAPGPEETVAGTVAYMAPERLTGAWREAGPWTDLYAVGCLATTLTSGVPPFGGTTAEEIRSGHLGARPRIAPTIPVPRGFEGWLLRLLAKDPQERYRRAADAARALAALPSVAGADTASSAREHDVATLVLPLADDDLLPLSDPTDPGERAALPPPHVPSDWRRRELRRDAEGLEAIRLFGLRPPPVVAREAERTALWQALRDAARGRSAALAVVAEAPGLGASTLAAWLCERALEVGAAHVVTVDGVAGEPAGAGLRRALVARWRAEGLAGGELVEHLARVAAPDGLGGTEAPALAAFLAGEGEAREAVLVLSRLAAAGPAILRVEGPVDPLLGAVSDELRDRPVPLFLVAAGPFPGATVLPVGALVPEDARALLDALAPLDRSLADAMVERAGGSPAWLVHALTHLVQRERLERGPTGWRMRPPGEPLPATLEALWEARVRWLTDGLSPAGRAALVLAARLGTVVAPGPWESACAAAEVDGRAEVEARLVDGRLARRHPCGFAFVHDGVRAAIAL